MDGRDTSPTSGAEYLAALQQKMREYGVGKIASVSGRYYAMDRDKRWERERKAFDAMVNGKAEGGAYPDPSARVKELYNNGITDEFVIPFVVVDDAMASPSDRFAMKMSASTSTSAQTAHVRSRAYWRATAGSTRTAAAIFPERKSWTRPFRDPYAEESHYLCMTQYDKIYDLPHDHSAGIDG